MSGQIVAAMVVRARRRIVEDLEAASATAPERAMPYAPSDRPIPRRVFARLRKHGAVVEARPGTFYLDRDRLADYQRQRRTRAAAILAVAAAAVGAAIAFG